MFQETINEKINNIHLLQKEDLPFFRELKNKYPYAEIFQLIHLHLVKKNDSISFEDELGKVAYKIRDRHKLIELLDQNTELIPIDENQIEIEDKSLLSEEIKIEETNQESILQSPIDIASEQIEIIENETENLNTQIAAEALSTIFSKDFEPTIQFQLDEEKIDEESFSNKSNETLIEEKNQVNSHKSFTSWLKSGKKEEKLDKNQLIDTIIATNPTISRPKKEFYSPSKQAIKSVDDEKLVYTETLAKILEMQGNFSKAISAYEQLSLTIPEKKTYFAQKIKDLNDKLNSK